MKTRIIVSLLTLIIATVGVAQAGPPTGPVVNINTATASQLELLPRVGPALAKRIVEFRKANGPFKNIDELLAVKGIGERSLERLRPYVTTSGTTTLTEKVHLPRSGKKPEKGH